MKFAERSNQAAESLGQAVPIKVKYNIRPTPLYYAPWYTYVSNRLPDLNGEFVKILDTMLAARY